MKSVEEIQRRLNDIKESNDPSVFADTEIGYLEIALKYIDNIYYLEHLIRKYSFDNLENEVIIKTLNWVLDK